MIEAITVKQIAKGYITCKGRLNYNIKLKTLENLHLLITFFKLENIYGQVLDCLNCKF